VFACLFIGLVGAGLVHRCSFDGSLWLLGVGWLVLCGLLATTLRAIERTPMNQTSTNQTNKQTRKHNKTREHENQSYQPA
jgi:hypothetical protein